MCAIPSPQDRTLPVSRTSIRASNPLISSLRISLISDGLISAIEALRRRKLLTQTLFSVGESGCDAGVVNFPFELGDYPAQQFVIDIDCRNHFFSRGGFECLHHPLNLRV